MKHILVLFLFMLPLCARGQEVFTALLNSAQEVLDNPLSDDVQIKVAQFKLTALRYTHRKMVQLTPNAPAHLLDVQAYSMSEFVTRFLADVRRHQYDDAKVRKEAVLRYINATVAFPMFNDQDKETTHVYVFDDDNLTPFCLDTDWEKALNSLGEAGK